MAKILSIETSTSVCSLAIHEKGQLVSLVELDEPGVHAEKIILLVEEAMSQASLSFGDLDAIAVSEGPGSYTGLRIGVSTAKGLAYGLNIPLIGINTLQGLASSIELGEGQIVIAGLDARRMEVYSQVFDWEIKPLSDIEAVLLSPESYQNYLERYEVFFLGDAIAKMKSVIHHDKARFKENLKVSASHLGKIADAKFNAKQFEDLAYFVPNYLKEFKALQSKKNPLLNL